MAQAARTPDKLAAVCGPETLSYQALAQRMAATAECLRAHGIEPGQRVAVETENALEHLIGLLAVMSIGAIAVALSRDAASYQAVVADCEPSLIIATGDATVESEQPLGVPRQHLRDLVSDANPAAEQFGRSPRSDEIAMLYYTSGTSSGV